MPAIAPLPSSSPARPFSETWTLEDTRDWVQANNLYPKPLSVNKGFRAFGQALDTWFKETYSPLSSRLGRRMAEHLCWLAGEGKLVEPPSADHLNVPWLRALRALKENPAQALTPDVVEALVGPLQVSVLFLADATDVGTDKTGTLLHASVHKMIAEGNFECAFHQSLLCDTTGQSLDLKVKGWQFQLGRLHSSGKNATTFTPLTKTSLASPTLQYVPFSVPSGEVWIHDDFDVKKFADQINALIQSQSKDSENGLENALHLRTPSGHQRDFLSVETSLPTTHITLHDGRLELGPLRPSQERVQEDPPQASCPPLYQVLGKIENKNKSMSRRVTLTDKQRLEECLSMEIERPLIRKALEAYQEKYAATLTILNVRPGTYHAYFSKKPDIVVRPFDAEGVPAQDTHLALLVMSPLPLVQETVPTPSSSKTKRGP